MFGFFGKKKTTYSIKDIVWKNKAIKFQELLKVLQASKTQIGIIYYFNDTLEDLEAVLNAQGVSYSHELESLEKIVLLNARLMTKTMYEKLQKNVIFAEHHPSYYKEENLLQQLSNDNKSDFTFYVALDEPMMLAFGGEKIVSLLTQMGSNESEAFEHRMISDAIQGVQKKIDERQPFTSDTHTSTAWFQVNRVV